MENEKKRIYFLPTTVSGGPSGSRLNRPPPPPPPRPRKPPPPPRPRPPPLESPRPPKQI